MRPASIVNFERFYLASIAVGVINTVVDWGDMQAEAASEAAAAGTAATTGVLVAIVGFGFLIGLLFWYLIARRASNIAKWILVALFAVGLLFTILTMTGLVPMAGGTVGLSFTLAITALEAIAVYFLFKPDAVAWLKGEGPVDPAAFS